MANYTFKPKSSTLFVDWKDPTIWTDGVVPNEPEADVNFPLVTYAGTDQAYISYVGIDSGESFTVRSVNLRDTLELNGSLKVLGTLMADQNGVIGLTGSLTVDRLVSDASIQGIGTITVREWANSQTLQAQSGKLALNATSLVNDGAFNASVGTLEINTPRGGFANLIDGVLTGGSYSARGDNGLAGTLVFNTGDVITELATQVSLRDIAMISSFDRATGTYISLENSLERIAPLGRLDIDGSYTFDDLEIAGILNLGNRGTIKSSQLIVESTGRLQGAGIIDAPILNNGSIIANYANGFSLESFNLIINGSVTGQGSLVVGPPLVTGGGPRQPVVLLKAVLDLRAPTDQDVFFSGDGSLILAQPSTFTGAIHPQGVDTIRILGISADSVTGTSYVGGVSGGVLEVKRASDSLFLDFVGNLGIGSFKLSAGPQRLSSDAPSLDIRVDSTIRGSEVPSDFNGDGLSDILWRRSDGLVTNWLSANGSANDNPALLRSVSVDWQVKAVGDFNGDGRADILWQNNNGLVTDWLATGNSLADNSAVMRVVGKEWAIAGSADFNGDGRQDILWRNQDGTVTDWLSQFDASGGPFSRQTFADNPAATRSVGLDWTVQGTGDFDGDGRDEILWRDNRGVVTAWRSTGDGFADNPGFTRAAGTEWRIVGTGDFDGNGSTDILWRRSDGLVTDWLSDGSRFNDNASNLLRAVSNEWQIQDTGDYNGDGLTDILWRTSGGLVTQWLSTGVGFVDNGQLIRQVGTDWSIIGV